MEPKRPPKFVPVLVLVALVGGAWWWTTYRHGSKIENGGIEVYYKDGATKEEADRLLAFLVRNWGATGERRSVQLIKKDALYQMRMVVKPEFRTNDKVLNGLAFEGARIGQEVLNGAAVEIDACDESLNTLRTIPPRADIRHALRVGKAEIFYPDGLDRAEVERFAKYVEKLSGDKPPEGYFKLARRGDVAEVHGIVQPAVANDPAFLALVEGDCKVMSRDVFDHRPVEFHLCDDSFTVQRVVK